MPPLKVQRKQKPVALRRVFSMWGNGLIEVSRREAQNGRFCPDRPALPRIKGLGWTKTHDKTFVVLGGFWHSAA